VKEKCWDGRIIVVACSRFSSVLRGFRASRVGSHCSTLSLPRNRLWPDPQFLYPDFSHLFARPPQRTSLVASVLPASITREKHSSRLSFLPDPSSNCGKSDSTLHHCRSPFPSERIARPFLPFFLLTSFLLTAHSDPIWRAVFFFSGAIFQDTRPCRSQ